MELMVDRRWCYCPVVGVVKGDRSGGKHGQSLCPGDAEVGEKEETGRIGNVNTASQQVCMECSKLAVLNGPVCLGIVNKVCGEGAAM